MQKDIFKTMEPEMKILGVTPEELRSRNRSNRLADARSMMAAILIKEPDVHQVDIADLYGFSQVAVSKMLTRHKLLLRVNRDYRNRFTQLQDERRPQ